MIDKDGDAKIMDFGIARSLSGKGITSAGVLIGTPEYMSPEQVEGKEADQRADIYALGVILFEMVTGETGQFGSRRACDLVPDVPQWLDELIERCTARDSARRFRTTEEVSAALLTLKSAAAG